MRKNTIITAMILWAAIAVGTCKLTAQSLGLEYSSEWQTDFKGGYDWLNFLKLTGQLPLGEHLQLDATTLSVAKTGDTTLIDDLLTYSNIEAGNIALTFARLGFAIEAGKSNIFIGVNNVNEDYFTSDYTAFFTNSSCGISPTLSCNYDIANFPMASLGVYYGIQLGDFKAQTSLYTGQGHTNIFGRDNLFNLNLKKDGVFSISSLEYKHSNIYCVVGAALFDGVCIYDKESEATPETEEGEAIQTPAFNPAQKLSKAPMRRAFPFHHPLYSAVYSRSDSPQDITALSENTSPEKKLYFSPWVMTEISLPHNFGLLLHGSLSTVKRGCKSFATVGLLHDINNITSGISVNYATFSNDKECDIELCSQIPVYSDKTFIKPALHIVTSDREGEKTHCHCIGMLRFTLNI